jgi:hypothetical protein
MRRRDALRGLAAGAAGAAALASGGCHWLTAWALAPRHEMRTVKAEYDLKADRLVIVPYVSMDILFAYPTAGIEISNNLVHGILAHLKGRVREIVNPVEVARWQDSNIEWMNMSLPDIAAAFEADTVLYLEIEQYTAVEERSANLLRGHIRARMQVAKAGTPHPVYESRVEVTFPEDQPVGVLGNTERQVMTYTLQIFAQQTIGKFYDHEVEVKGGKP